LDSNYYKDTWPNLAKKYPRRGRFTTPTVIVFKAHLDRGPLLSPN
jgi:hypothetical protein